MNLPTAGIAIGAFIAFANGANDVSKGIATLAGSGATNLRKAICTTGLAAFIFAGEMVNTFGKGFLSPGSCSDTISGSCDYAGCGNLGSAVNAPRPARFDHSRYWGAKVAILLLLSPVLSMLFTRLILMLWKESRTAAAADCLCAEVSAEPVALATATNYINVAAGALPDLKISSCSEVDREAYHPKGISFTLDHLHWLTSGSVSFARPE